MRFSAKLFKVFRCVPFKYPDKLELELVGSAIKAKLSTHDSVQMVPVSRLPLHIYLSAFRDWRSKDQLYFMGYGRDKGGR